MNEEMVMYHQDTKVSYFNGKGGKAVTIDQKNGEKTDNRKATTQMQ